MSPILIIIVISLIGPIFGSLIGVLKKPSERYIHNMLAFAAGVMLAVSFLQLIPQSIELSSVWLCVFGIAIGSLVMFALDKALPHIHPELCSQEQGRNLHRTATYLLIGIFLHNFPEGLAMGIGVVTEINLSYLIALAITIHDIPEGICTSAPYFFVSKKRLKSFFLSAATAIPTVIGFLLSYFLFPKIPLAIVGIIIAATGGIMIYIASDELIPTSCNKDNKTWSHSTIFSLITGVLFVVVLGSI
jgi:ZIP family zinc transporter